MVAMVQDYLAEIAPGLPSPAKERIARVWQDKDRYAFTFHTDALFGFALIRALPNAAWEMSEFYIAPSHRRRGFGRQAVADILRRCPGRWQLGLAKGSTGARDFWVNALSEYHIKRGPPLTPHQSGSLHFIVTETVT